MKIEHHKSLQNYNTFGIHVTAREFVEVTSQDQLKEVLHQNKEKEIFVLSGGSNMLLTKNVDALVIHIAIKGIEIIETTKNHVILSANAGENWHDFVQFCIDHDFGGLENLSLIPGYVGSAPIQNIGAYGVELKDSMIRCEAIQIATKEHKIFDNKDCNFGYRDSIFKNEAKGEYIITKVTFKLTTNNHALRTDYGAIKGALKKNNITTTPTIKDIANAVIEIRKSKLPDPKEIGNSGSFFKNPIIKKEHFEKLQKEYHDIPFYKIDENYIKVPAGWLVETCGFKGKRWGDAGVHKKQALVLVNYDNATGKEIQEVSEKIKTEIKNRFNINLETEVNII